MKNYLEMSESVFSRRDKYFIKKKQQLKKITTAIFCLCICALLGAGAWQSGVFVSRLSSGADPGTEIGSIEIDDIETGSETVAQTDGTKPVLSADTVRETETTTRPDSEDPAVSVDTDSPARDFTELTEEELYAEAGALLPDEAPQGFSFESAYFSDNRYSVLWSDGTNELSWRIRDYEETDARYVTSVKDTQNYDLSLYTIPLCDSVPEGLIQIVNSPIFRAEEMTQEAVSARVYNTDASGDSSGSRMNFSVLYDNKVISIASKGVSPEWLYSQLTVLFDLQG